MKINNLILDGQLVKNLQRMLENGRKSEIIKSQFTKTSEIYLKLWLKENL